MSYILEALKKADRERMVGHVPDLEAVHDVSPPKRRHNRWFWLLGALLVINGLLVMALMLRDDGGDEVAGEAASEIGGVIAQAPPVVPPKLAPAATPEPAPPPRPSWNAYYEPPARQVQPRHPPVEAGSAPAPPAATGGGRVVYMEEPLTGEPEETVPEAPPAAVAPQPVIGATSQAQQGREPTDSVLPDWDDLPLEFRSSFQVPRIDVHVYDTDPRQRFILVNLIKYRPGDRLESGALLEQITPDGVQLLFRGKRFIYRQ